MKVWIVEQGEWNEPCPRLSAFADEPAAMRYIAEQASTNKWSRIEKEAWESDDQRLHLSNGAEKIYVKLHCLDVAVSPDVGNEDDVIFRNYLTPFPVSAEPLVQGMSTAEWQELERKEKERFARGETREITQKEFRDMTHEEVLMGIKLPATADEWLRNHLFTMGDRPKPSSTSTTTQGATHE